MDRRTFLKTVPAFAVLAASGGSFAQDTAAASKPSQAAGPAPTTAPDLEAITLPKPQTDGGKSVLAALRERKTIRDISPEKLSPQMLSNLLWAAWGVNRQNGPSGQPGRTAASASN